VRSPHRPPTPGPRHRRGGGLSVWVWVWPAPTTRPLGVGRFNAAGIGHAYALQRDVNINLNLNLNLNPNFNRQFADVVASLKAKFDEAPLGWEDAASSDSFAWDFSALTIPSVQNLKVRFRAEPEGAFPCTFPCRT
jgi:hypothetical protein